MRIAGRGWGCQDPAWGVRDLGVGRLDAGEGGREQGEEWRKAGGAAMRGGGGRSPGVIGSSGSNTALPTHLAAGHPVQPAQSGKERPRGARVGGAGSAPRHPGHTQYFFLVCVFLIEV